jgi:acyl dehydratase
MPEAKLYWEDFSPGQIFMHGPRRITREEIVGFAAEFDPQPMHLDEEAARSTLLGGLGASGWHACAIFMRMLAESFMLKSASMGSPGVDEVKWLIPIRPDDRLTLKSTIVETRASNSRPDRGFIKVAFEMLNQSGDCVMTLGSSLMISRRGAGKPA